ncbi:MAG: 4-diphosphocytidyl-2-C-methyl-D-erythritol kinase, partial [uncultured Rubrobacteraceae bacterium]
EARGPAQGLRQGQLCFGRGRGACGRVPRYPNRHAERLARRRGDGGAHRRRVRAARRAGEPGARAAGAEHGLPGVEAARRAQRRGAAGQGDAAQERPGRRRPRRGFVGRGGGAARPGRALRPRPLRRGAEGRRYEDRGRRTLLLRRGDRARGGRRGKVDHHPCAAGPPVAGREAAPGGRHRQGVPGVRRGPRPGRRLRRPGPGGAEIRGPRRAGRISRERPRAVHESGTAGGGGTRGEAARGGRARYFDDRQRERRLRAVPRRSGGRVGEGEGRRPLRRGLRARVPRVRGDL